VLDRVAAVPRPRRLQDLPGHQPLERLGLDPHRLRAQVGQDVRGAGEQEVAGEHRHRIAPTGVGAGHTAADVRLVHDVVVVERRQVRELDDDGGGHHPGRVRIAELRGKQHQQRPEPLAARPHQVLGRLGDERHVALRGLQQALFNRCQPGLGIGFQSPVPHAQPEGPDDAHGVLLSACGHTQCRCVVVSTEGSVSGRLAITMGAFPPCASYHFRRSADRLPTTFSALTGRSIVLRSPTIH
jgi:hypothetical protein